jgi:hypothetical protein
MGYRVLAMLVHRPDRFRQPAEGAVQLLVADLFVEPAGLAVLVCLLLLALRLRPQHKGDDDQHSDDAVL